MSWVHALLVSVLVPGVCAAQGSTIPRGPGRVPDPRARSASTTPDAVGRDDGGNVHQAFVDAYVDDGGWVVLGDVADNGGGQWVHRWGAGLVQDLFGPSSGSSGRAAIMQPDGSPVAFVIKGGAWEAYLALGGGEGACGYPIGGEANGRQHFLNGTLVLESGAWRFVVRRVGAVFGLDLGGRTASDDGFLDFVASTGVPWVRVNFIRHRDAGDWYRDYDGLVNGLLARGIGVYGLINTEAVEGDSGPLARGDDDGVARAYVDGFASTARAVVGHFRDRVRTFELVNEPNNWNADRVARVHETWMALILQRTYERVKLDHANDPSWQVTLVSGAVLSHSLTYADDYLREVWTAGRRDHGWDDVRARCGRFPVDGVGYHIYVLEDPSSRPDEVAPTYARHLDAVEDFLRAHDPEAADKKIWLSEFGWRSSLPQAPDMLDAGFEALGADPRVAIALSFALQDFVLLPPDNDPGAGPQLEDWGLLDVNGNPKPDMIDRFREVMRR